MAKKSELPLVRISQIGKVDGACCVSDHFAISGPDWGESGLFDRPVRLSGGLLGICTQGECRLSVNQRIFDMRVNDLLVVFPDSVVHVSRRSAGFRLCVVGFSTDLLKGIPQSVLPMYPYIHENPVLPITGAEARMLLCDCAVLKEKTVRASHIYFREVMFHLLLCLFFEISALYQQSHPKNNRRLSRHEEIFNRLMELISLHFREQRRTAFYARALCLTPKYLSTVVRRISNKSVTEWIDEAVITEAKNLLRSTQMNVQQIANNLNFPNPSFFSRFFRERTGLTPKAYRERG